ncbi:methylenetetrahydrofolate reductase [Mesorhizobium tianshanense]|uniref:Methylenetetrahydrofolate reductase n=1 Tax=Mesorhizobium tianshanense TaxID=39844 RepID=A0A562PBX7_9HYPH|nr:methylenetetrahydrofolate reductase [Mesorhizobium tianshanense]TWI41921.1 methylenetetrahydrofolate reductase (NADPH) [Mesorhizobium tianshanense]GLS34754.1 methylenetetrahydrofolate reductase [Mesorhizobium tianshanense]
MDWWPARAGTNQTAWASADGGLAKFLANYSVEVTARDADATAHRLPPGGEVFVANLPQDSHDLLVAACSRLRMAGLIPVPHIVARKIRDRREFDDLIGQLVGEAGVDRVLALGGDHERPVGAFDASLQLIRTGSFERYGIRQIAIACYPEGHPRIGDQVLQDALKAKLAAIAESGIGARLVSQFAFKPEPVLDFARKLRAAGISVPLRVGVAGPAHRATLIKYAMRCGVGASLRALTERRHLVAGLLGTETPEELLTAIALAFHDDSSLRIEGVHFFTFGAPERSVEWAQDRIDGRKGFAAATIFKHQGGIEP